MDPPSRVQSFYHSAMMPITWLCTLSEEEEKKVKLSGSCLSTFYGFGSTQLSDILMSYRCPTFSWQNKAIKVCVKYILAFYQN